MNYNWNFPEHAYGPFLPFIQDPNVTDINYNGKTVWIDDIKKGRYCAAITISKDFEKQFIMRIKNTISANFNPQDNLLEAETADLRISVIHESVAQTGNAISIRKTPPILRLQEEMMLTKNYCSIEIINLLKNCIRSHLNIVICGLTGCGKTELLKWLTHYIPACEKVITIEDNLEIRYASINPDKDCVELKVSDLFPYTKAIKASLRQLPKWILLSEARSIEVKYLMECLSTGHHGITTLHTDDVRYVPERMKNMMPDAISSNRLEQDIYTFINVGILIQKRITTDGAIHRYISQVCFYTKEDTRNTICMVLDDNKLTTNSIPSIISKKFEREGINDPFQYPS